MARFQVHSRKVVFQWAFVGASQEVLASLVEQVCGRKSVCMGGVVTGGSLSLPRTDGRDEQAEVFAISVPNAHPSVWKQVVERADVVVGLVDGRHPRSSADQLVLDAFPDAVVRDLSAELVVPNDSKLSLLSELPYFLIDESGEGVEVLRQFLVEQSRAGMMFGSIARSAHTPQPLQRERVG